MSDISLPESPAPSISSFSTACTTLPPTEIVRLPGQTTEEQMDNPWKRLSWSHGRPLQRQEITNQTLLLSSPLATLIYTASNTAAALPPTHARPRSVLPRTVPDIGKKGDVLRKKRARGGRPERLVRMGGPEVKVEPRIAVVELDQ